MVFGVACFSEARYVFVGVCLDFVVVWFCRVCCFGFRWDRFLLCSWDSHVLKFCLDLVLSLVVAGVVWDLFRHTASVYLVWSPPRCLDNVILPN